jgi:hypothetical protein
VDQTQQVRICSSDGHGIKPLCFLKMGISGWAVSVSISRNMMFHWISCLDFCLYCVLFGTVHFKLNTVHYNKCIFTLLLYTLCITSSHISNFTHNEWEVLDVSSSYNAYARVEVNPLLRFKYPSKYGTDKCDARVV